MDNPVHACLIVDDTPANGTYWRRLQANAFGFPVSETGWGERWRELAPAAWFRPAEAQAFADLLEEFDVRGKFTFLPCPAGLGRADQSVRTYPQGPWRELVGIVRDRIAPRMDITPEVLTHSMALEPDTGALLPHAETAWLSHLCASGQRELLLAYLHHAYHILHQTGLRPHGLTTGGMEDVSGIGGGKSVLQGDCLDVLGEALLTVEREFRPGLQRTFLYTGAPPVSEAGRRKRAPERVYQAADGAAVFLIHSLEEDPLLPVLYGQRERAEETTDALVSADLSRGRLVEEGKAGRPLVFTVHAQTLLALNTGLGLRILREVCRRLRQRFGKRLVWCTPDELCARAAGSSC